MIDFTFQYGQIYYKQKTIIKHLQIFFTFQYGQIYYKSKNIRFSARHSLYIPIWLDLLYAEDLQTTYQFLYFTFQYGQIYYLQKMANIHERLLSLHSNMVRFIISLNTLKSCKSFFFTFQYGQIYYHYHRLHLHPLPYLYIPIWLDLLLIVSGGRQITVSSLHSNMVRFIIFTRYF